jgi:hypothetical protein
MGIINVQGLGKVEIQGNTPTKEEEQAIINQLQSTEDSLATETSIPEIITPSLGEEPKLRGLEYIGGRPTFEATGALAGGIPGTVAGGLAGSVAGGTLGAMGGGQIYDILQSNLVGDEIGFGTQIEAAKKDFQREALLQSIFSKIPGVGTKLKRAIFGQPNKELYNAAKRMNFPLSLSDSGNMVSKGYGRVIGVFPYVGTPIKKQFAAKADIINKTADDTLNMFAPNVNLTKLGIDMAEASKSTYGEFRRISGLLYDDFYDTASKVKAPIIPTNTFKDSLKNYINLIDDGVIKVNGKKLKSPQKDAIYQYAKSAEGIDPFITVPQYKRLIKDIQKFSKLSQKEGFDIKVLTGFKGALEKDLNKLTNKKYLDSFKKVVDTNQMKNVAEKLKLANKVYSEGLENSIIVKTASGQKMKIPETVGIKAFEQPVAGKFRLVDKNIFGSGFERPGSITADQLGNVILSNKNVSPQYLKDLKNLIGEKPYKSLIRARIQQSFDKSLVPFREGGVNGLMFDPYNFENALGLNNAQGRELIKEMLQGSKLTIEKLDDFFAIAKNHAGLEIPDVSKFVARRATLGGTKSLFGGFAMGYSTYKEPFKGLAMVYLARKGSGFLANPKQLDDVMSVLDPESSAFKVKNSALKIADGLISDSQNNLEKSYYQEYKEYFETTPLDQIKKDLGLEN